MKETPLLFKSEMVRAILDGRKTQTRRLIKPEHLKGSMSPHDVLSLLGPQLLKEAANYAPLGQAGDRIWVKETFCYDDFGDVIYRATEPDQGCSHPEDMSNWKPSIFMPRRASRITLELTAVRVERLQDISEADAIAEGCRDDEDPYWRPSYSDPDSGGNPSAKLTYEWLWGSINGPGSWAKNPWVFVYSFRKL